MYSLSQPTLQEIQKYLAQQSKQPFSYQDVGASLKIWKNPSNYLSDLSSRYIIDRNRLRLGSGAKVFEQSKAALGRWEMFRFNWVQLLWSETPIQSGSTVGIMLQQFGLWAVNACRIVDVIEEEQVFLKRFGFAYGTLPDHGLAGEERFMVEWNREDDTVWYDLFAFSRPNQCLTRIGYWYVRRIQKRFANASKQAMVQALTGSTSSGYSPDAPF